jgi:hypothetical protein
MVRLQAATQGDVVLRLTPTGMHDAAGNELQPPPLALNGTVHFEPDHPSCVVARAPGQRETLYAFESFGSVAFRAVFNKPVSALSPSKILADVGTTGATLVTATRLPGPLSDRVFDVVVSGITDAGEIRVSVPANAVQDHVGNGNDASSGANNTVTLLPRDCPEGLTKMGLACCVGNCTSCGWLLRYMHANHWPSVARQSHLQQLPLSVLAVPRRGHRML